MWKEREPEYARRIDQETHAGDLAALGASEAALAAEPAPELSPVGAVERTATANQASEAKRERRRQRRRARPHGRAR
jgi:hypothetical protein